MGQTSMREHLLMSVTKCDSWTNFVREIESIEHARTARTPMELDVFQGNCHKCGKYGHTAKECRSSSHGGAAKPQCAQCGKEHHGQSWIRSYTSSHKASQKGGWKGDRAGNGKGTQKGGKFKGGKGGNHGKGRGRGKKGQRLNVITEAPKEQWTGGSWEQWPEQSWNAEADTASLRDDDWCTADSNSQTSAAAEEFQHASVADLRLSNTVLSNTSNLCNMNDWILHSELSHLVLIRSMQNCCSCQSPAARVYLVHKDSLLGCAYSIRPRQKCMIKERGSCAP